MAATELAWRLGARYPGNDYAVFTTAFIEGEHPSTGERKRFSVIDSADWVNIIALTQENHVVLVRQYRVGANHVCLEIPGGMVDPGETPAQAAARELLEETGYTAAHWQQLGRVSPNPALHTNSLYTFLATGAEQTAAQRLDSSEVIDVEHATLADCHSAIRAGRIDHALVIVAFAHLWIGSAPLLTPSVG